VHSERYAREPDGRRVLSNFDDLEDQVPLASVDCALPLSEIYEKVEFARR
jgi:hypothetical protein